jgi:anti-sigma regulatory factor (Ser/Thr protein kinase)
LFGSERLIAVLRSHATESAGEILYRLREAIRMHTSDSELDDDFTVVIVRACAVEQWERTHRGFLSHLGNLSEMRQFVGYVALECGLDHREIDELQLAAHEALTNVIRHAHRGAGKDVISINAERIPNGVRLGIDYEGEPFVPGEVSEPSISLDREGGWGLFII